MKRCLWVAVALLAGGALWAAQEAGPKGAPASIMAPEIPPSVQFAGGYPGLALQDLKGKIVLVIFFQSWCPICNGWSGEMFKQIQEAGAGKRDVVLAAVKTDGGGVQGALRYLQGRADPAKWLVGSDPNVVWGQAAMGKDELYLHMLVGPDGNVIERGQAGRFYTRDKTYFVLADRIKKLLSDAKTETVLPKDKTYPDILAPIVQAAELRQYGLALRLCNLAARGAAKEAVATLKADLLQAIDDRSKALGEVLAKADADGAARIEAFLELKRIAANLGRSAVGKSAAKAVSAAAKDKTLAGEMQAGQEYTTLHEQAAKVKDFAKNFQFVTALKSLAQRHPGTKFGKMAADEAATIEKASRPTKSS